MPFRVRGARAQRPVSEDARRSSKKLGNHVVLLADPAAAARDLIGHIHRLVCTLGFGFRWFVKAKPGSFG
jgi:hypothetical protein